MGRSTFGAFRELYQGRGIYWQDSSYNIEGNGSYRTIADCRAAIVAHNATIAKREADAKQEAVTLGAIPARRNGDSVTVELPSGTVTVTVREYRQNVFNWESQFDRDIVLL